MGRGPPIASGPRRGRPPRAPSDRGHGCRRSPPPTGSTPPAGWPPPPVRARGGGPRSPAGVLDEDGELIATQAGRRAPGADAGPKTFGDGDQEGIAGLVSQAVVDGLEVVEVDEEHGQGSRPAGAPRQS